MIGAGLALMLGLRSIYVTGGVVFLVMAFVVGRWLPTEAPAPRASSRTA